MSVKHSEEFKTKQREIRMERKRVLGYINSPESREKMRQSALGRKMTEADKIKMRLAKLGKPRAGNPENWKHTNESKEKNRISHLGKVTWNKGIKGTAGFALYPEIRYKGPAWNKGIKYSEEYKKRLSKAHIGKKHSDEWKKNMSERMKGEKHPMWIHDRTKLQTNHKERHSYRNSDWVKQVKKRDNKTCKINNKECNGRLEAHHILPWRDYPELRYDINNGITLCKFHHPRKYVEERKLSNYFQELILK